MIAGSPAVFAPDAPVESSLLLPRFERLVTWPSIHLNNFGVLHTNHLQEGHITSVDLIPHRCRMQMQCIERANDISGSGKRNWVRLRR